MEFLYWLEQLRAPWLTQLMLMITELGGETVFLALALVFFWCVDKRRGYYLMSVGFTGTICNQFLKIFFRVPRPWVLDPGFEAVEAAVPEASGYSFPSGHSQAAVGSFGCLAWMAKNKWSRILFVTAAILVPFSRMYLGVHTPADVLTGVGISLVLVFALRPLVYSEKTMPWIIGVMAAMAAAYLVYVTRYPFPAEVDAHNLESARKSAYTLFGCIMAMAAVYPAERRWLNFSTGGVWWVQILKILGGLALVLAVKEGMKAPLEAVLPVLTARAVRYFLVVVTAGLVWPATFRWFAKLGRRKK